MGRLLVGFDEVVKGDDEIEGKVLDLAFNGYVGAYVKVAAPYSVIKEYVGQKITVEDQYHLFEPVRQRGIKAFKLDPETIREIIRFGEAGCQFFKSGIGFDDNDALVEYKTITRNYVPGIKEKFYGTNVSPLDYKKIKEGGVYVDNGSEAGTGCDFEYIYKKELPRRDVSGLMFGCNLNDPVLKGLNSYSGRIFKAMLSSVMIYSVGFLSRFDPRFDLCWLQWILVNRRMFYIPFHCLVENRSWPPKKELASWHSHEVLPDPEGGGVFLRPRARNEYVLCSFNGQMEEIEDGAKNCFVPRPINISIKSSDIQFLTTESDLIIKVLSGEVELICEDRGEGKEDSNEKGVDDLDKVEGFERCRSIAVEWICDLAKVEEAELSNAEKLIDYVAIAVCTWEKPLESGKADKDYCRQLMHALPTAYPTYSEKLVRLVAQSQSPKRKSVGKARDLVVRSKDVDILKKTSLPILIEAWSQFVFVRAKTAKKEKKQEWKRVLDVFLERHQIKTDYHTAVADVLLSDQDKENLFI